MYVRQSTADQLRNNHESRRRQYALADRARTLGWSDVVVIDDDLGVSAGGVARPGFERLLAAICSGQVGAVVSIEASRLARNGRDWHTLLDFCGLVGSVGPHRVKTNQHFYLREGARKRQLDVPEIRGLFLRSESQIQRVRDFRTERISRILTGEGTPGLAPGAILVMHLVPSEAALGLMQVDPLGYVPSSRAGARYLPLLAKEGGGSPGINLDGALFLRHGATAAVLPGYSLFFRNGFFEATQVIDSVHRHDDAGRFNLPGRGYEDVCIKLIDGFRTELKHLGVSTEMTVMLTLLHANRVRVGLPASDYGQSGPDGLFDRQHVVLTDVQLQVDVPTELALKPVFDLMGQACGLAGSPYYDEKGQRIAGR